MSPRPDPAEFAARYDAGRPQVVWTSLVADLETPVSAMLKLAEGRPYSFLFESVEGGAVRGRYSAIGLKPDLIWRCSGDQAEINRSARHDRAAYAPCPDGALASLRALIGESRIALPEALPPMAAGLFGFMAYDMVRLMERLPTAKPDPLGNPRRDVRAADGDGDLRQHRGPGGDRDPGLAERRARRARRLRSRLRAPRGCGRRFRSRPAAPRRLARRRHPARAGLQRHPGALSRDGRGGQGVHPRRRHLPGRALTALHGAVRIAAVRALPRAASAQPLAVPVLPRFRRVRPGRLEPGDPGPAARRRGGDPADRRHPAARRDAGRGRGARRRDAGRSEGARRAPDAARPRAQRRRPRGRDRQRPRDRADGGRILQPRHASSCPTWRAGSAPTRTRWTR